MQDSIYLTWLFFSLSLIDNKFFEFEIEEENMNNLNEQLFQELDDQMAANLSGGTVYLYANGNFTGRKLTFNEGSSNLGTEWDFNDKTQSIEITGNETWKFYNNDKYGDWLANLGPGKYTDDDLSRKGMRSNITSLKKA